MRLLLLPISTRRSLIFCEKTANHVPTSQQSYMDRITNKANMTWADWEKADGGWKKKLTQYGNMMFRRIPFEEWGLKSIPQRKPTNSKTSAAQVDKKLENPVEVIYPGLFQGLTGQDGVRQVLKRIATERQELHRKRMWYSMIGMPLTIPFALVPMYVVTFVEPPRQVQSLRSHC